MSAVFSNWKNKRHFWKVFCSSTVTFSKTIRFYLFPSLVEFFFYHYRSPCFRCFSFRVRHFSKTGNSVSILLQALKGVGNREKGKKGGGFHSIPFSPLSHFSPSLSPPLFAPATQAKILHVKRSEIPFIALGYSWFATTWQGGHVGGQYNIIFFSKNLHENRV